MGIVHYETKGLVSVKFQECENMWSQNLPKYHSSCSTSSFFQAVLTAVDIATLYGVSRYHSSCKAPVALPPCCCQNSTYIMPKLNVKQRLIFSRLPILSFHVMIQGNSPNTKSMIMLRTKFRTSQPEPSSDKETRRRLPFPPSLIMSLVSSVRQKSSL